MVYTIQFRSCWLWFMVGYWVHIESYDFVLATLNFRLSHIETILCKPLCRLFSEVLNHHQPLFRANSTPILCMNMYQPKKLVLKKWGGRMLHYLIITGWWFGCHFLFSQKYWVAFIIPIDFHIFQRGGPTTNQLFNYSYIYIYYIYIYIYTTHFSMARGRRIGPRWVGTPPGSGSKPVQCRFLERPRRDMSGSSWSFHMLVICEWFLHMWITNIFIRREKYWSFQYFFVLVIDCNCECIYSRCVCSSSRDCSWIFHIFCRYMHIYGIDILMRYEYDADRLEHVFIQMCIVIYLRLFDMTRLEHGHYMLYVVLMLMIFYQCVNLSVGIWWWNYMLLHIFSLHIMVGPMSKFRSRGAIHFMCEGLLYISIKFLCLLFVNLCPSNI